MIKDLHQFNNRSIIFTARTECVQRKHLKSDFRLGEEMELFETVVELVCL